MSKKTLWFNEVGLEDVKLVGGKNASLGEMIRNLSELGIRVPNGFAVTTDAYQYFLEHNNLVDSIRNDLEQIDYNDHVKLCRIAQKIRRNIQNGEFPKDLENEILEKYKELSLMYKKTDDVKDFEADVAIRSSSTQEDLANISAAGMADSFLNCRGNKNICEKIKACFASLYTERAIDYRKNIIKDVTDVRISVGVQKMIRSDIFSSGVCFSVEVSQGNTDIITINSSWGLGESIVGGLVEPDEILISKPNLKKGYNAIVDKKLGSKLEKMIYSDSIEKRTHMIKVLEEERFRFSITDDQSIELGKWIILLEDYYSEKYGKYTPVDCEFAIDGLNGQLFLVQCRPETVHANNNKNILVEYKFMTEPPKPFAQGIGVCDKIATGKVKIILSLDTRIDKIQFEQGDILVCSFTSPDFEPIMKKASAVIAEVGGVSAHTSIICRELNIPAVLSVENATKIFKNNEVLTVSTAQGDVGYIYKGEVPFIKEETELNFNDPPCKIMLNVADPSQCYKFGKLPNSGIGLLRVEHLINNHIEIHPLALLYPEKITDNDTIERIKEITKGYTDYKEFYIDKLSFGIAKIVSAFIDKNVFLRFSDFKASEYYNLTGGKYFEPIEEASIIGWRGMSRYYSKQFQPAFELECQAVKRVRDIYGFKNLHVMFPFARTTKEVEKVQKILKEQGLERGIDGLQHALMCEVTSNVILADQFAKYVDYVSIGSNDLGMAAIMNSREDALVQHLFEDDEPCLKKMVSMAIKTYHEHGVPIGICGDRPSFDINFFKFLVEEGIDSISLSPNCVIKTFKLLQESA